MVAGGGGGGGGGHGTVTGTIEPSGQVWVGGVPRVAQAATASVSPRSIATRTIDFSSRATPASFRQRFGRVRLDKASRPPILWKSNAGAPRGAAARTP